MNLLTMLMYDSMERYKIDAVFIGDETSFSTTLCGVSLEFILVDQVVVVFARMKPGLNASIRIDLEHYDSLNVLDEFIKRNCGECLRT